MFSARPAAAQPGRGRFLYLSVLNTVSEGEAVGPLMGRPMLPLDFKKSQGRMSPSHKFANVACQI